MANEISIKGARVNNLKDVSISIPKNKLTVITGLSGSGKSSLAFDTVYAEGQRRYAESLNAYARQFMDVQDKPDVDEITGLSPTIAIDQRNTSNNPRSTVGTVTELYDHLRLLFSRIGVQHDPETGEPVRQHKPGEITEEVRTIARSSSEIFILSPLITEGAVGGKGLLAQLEQSGYDQARINGVIMGLSQVKKYKFDKDKRYDIDLVIGKITDIKKQNVATLIEKALDLSNGAVTIIDEDDGNEYSFTTYPCSPTSGKIFDPIEPRTFSFNSPYGACPRCTGLGYTLDIDTELVIPNPRLTLAEGAIQPWTRIVGNQLQYQKILNAVATVHNFSMDTPVQDLPKQVMDIVFYGTDGQTYVVLEKKVNFEGVVPNLTLRHAETDSEYIRKEIEQYMKETICPVCEGKRLKSESLAVQIGDFSISDIAAMTVEEALTFFQSLTIGAKKKGPSKEDSLFLDMDETETKVATPIIKESIQKLKNLMQVGLYYLSLDRSFATLSGGEAQRIRLSSQLSTGLTDVIYILDEPSIGLHARDNARLIETLKALRDLGNTVIVVEHDEEMMHAADYLIDVGPGAGTYGGEIVAAGKPADVKKNKRSVTGPWISGKAQIDPPKKYRKGNGKKIKIIGAKAFNLKNIDVDIPLGKLVTVTGVSGSGKSTLITKILSRALAKQFYRAKAEPGEHTRITGTGAIDKVISIDQTPIGRTPRSNPATYTGIFTAIRDIFTNVPEARMRGYDAGMFSFNVKGGGRCEACSGEGYVRIPMQFLTDVFVECTECHGRRYNTEALEIHYRQKSIADVLDMTVEEAHRFFNDVPAIADKLQILRDVGLSYLHLGQSATSLSGGEAQRIKLATELSRRATGKTLYILDEPTTGLHFEDIRRLLNVLDQLVEKGNTVLIIEHNLDVVKSADWVIDIGPEGGKRGGELVAAGTPADIVKEKCSITGTYLRRALKKPAASTAKKT